MELSLNISEDENYTFITNDLLEESENFDEWLDQDGVEFIINNERYTDNKKLTNKPLDPLLNQPTVEDKGTEDSDTELLESEGKVLQEIHLTFDSLTSKSEYIEKLVSDGYIYVEFKRATESDSCQNKINLYFSQSSRNGVECVFPRCYINLTELNGQLSVPQEKLEVTAFEKISIAEDLNALMPCLTLRTGLKVCLCPKSDCNTAYTKITAGKLHSLMHLEHKPFKCQYPDCTWAFYTVFKLKRHQDSHLNIKDFQCTLPNCGKRFSNLYNLNQHIKNHSRPAILDCSVKGCLMSFQTARMREKHFKSHKISEAPFLCPEENCSRAFFLMTGLQSHSRSHSHTESDVKCHYPNCGKVFKLPCRLKEHARTHTGQRPYVCDYDQCTWSFTSSSKLRRHQSSHKNERKFHCTIGNCSKSFLRPEHLKEHTITHIGPKTFTCEVCSEKFFGLSGKSCLYHHMKKHHPMVQQCARAIPFLLQQETEKASEKVNSQFSEQKQTADVLLEQAIQSLGVPSDMILGTGLIPDESMELLENGNFSTVNLRDLD